MTEPLVIVGLCASGLAGVIYILGRVRRAFKAFEALNGLIQHELTPNGGGSMFDKITRIDRSLEDHLVVAQQDHDDLVSVKQHLGLGL